LVAHIDGGTQAEGVEEIFGPKRDEVRGEWRKLHNEQLNDLYFSPNIVWVNTSIRMMGRGM